MQTQCPTCQQPYGKRKRCYYCNGRKRTGTTIQCAQCSKDFYAARWQLEDEPKRQPKYCSRACVNAAMEINGPGYEYQRVDGYISIYYPKHPDAPISGWMLKHRLVAEQKYGRRIGKDEHVHHVNRIRGDNRPENLEIISASEHAGISNRWGQQLRAAMKAELEEYRRRFGPLDDWPPKDK